MADHNAEHERWECGPHANSWGGHDARCRRVRVRPCRDCGRGLTPFEEWQAVEGEKVILPLCRTCFGARTSPASTPEGGDSRTYTTREAAELLDVPPAVISKWRHRGVVTPAGIVGSGRGVPVYLLTDLQPHADAYHQRQTPRR